MILFDINASDRSTGLHNFTGWSSLRHVGSLDIEGNALLTNIDALLSLTSIDADVTVLNIPLICNTTVSQLWLNIYDQPIYGGTLTYDGSTASCASMISHIRRSRSIGCLCMICDVIIFDSESSMWRTISNH